MKLQSPFSFFWYLMLQNRHSWNALDEATRKAVLEDNSFLNNQRPDYHDPSQYGKERFGADGDDNWDSTTDRRFRHRGRFLEGVLEKYKPKNILEIGPGAGFDSRLLCEASSTEHYTAIDIVDPFLQYLKPRLEKLKEVKKDFTYDLLCGDFKDVRPPKKFDAVFILSAIHHIPDRVPLFERLGEFLADGGIVVCYEPTHYLRRVLQLIRDFFAKGYFKRSHFTHQGNYSTHHFCTYAEFRAICRETGKFELVHKEHDTPKKLRARGLEGSPVDIFWLSREIGVVLQKKKAT